MDTDTSKYYVIDFDSTFTRVEALDILGEISLHNHPRRDVSLSEINRITNEGMAGNMSFRESLEQRISLLKAHKSHLEPLIDRLKEKVSKSFVRNREFFTSHKDHIFIISNGFKDFIDPIVADYGIDAENVHANTFEYDEEGYITGFDRNNVLSKDNGKVDLIRNMGLEGNVFVIGDGHNDYMIRHAGLADKFYAFTENIERKPVLEKADHIAPSLDEILYVHKLNKAISYPKNRIRVLLLENIRQEAFEILKEEGYSIEVIDHTPNEEELAEKIRKVSILGLGSKTKITEKVLAKAKRLLAVGVYAIGTDNIDLDACLKKGVAVFNAPFSKSRSVVEVVMAEMIMLMRKLPAKFRQMDDGRWNRVTCESFEVRGKKLGIIGYGSIGSQLSVIAESMGLNVVYYDKVERLALGNARKCHSIEELLSISDVVSLHIDHRPENKGLIGEKAFEIMKPGSIILNMSNGNAIDLKALKKHLENGHLHGAGLDVFPDEPEQSNAGYLNELAKIPNVLLTPHIAGNTEEASVNIAHFVPGKIMDYVNTGNTANSVNFPDLQLPPFDGAHRLIHIHENVPGILAKINQTLANHKINILGQYLKTNQHIGYVITDIDKVYGEDVIEDLKNIENTIRFRVLY